MMEHNPADKAAVLHRYFGYDAFRGGQEPLIDHILAGGDALGVMPTGAGKSLCYQVPALLLPGLSIIISPLISLMKDQVQALVQAGIAAAYLNSSLTPNQMSTVLARAQQGQYRLLYVAPERLQTQAFLRAIEGLAIPMVAVDEAHCVSQWGQDFRPSYLAISDFIAALPTRPAVAAYTATATPKVRKDICAMLRLKDPFVLVTGFDRENLYFGVQKPKDKTAALLAFLKERPTQSGIVYCSTRKAVEEVAQELNRHQMSATLYHAGLPDAQRHANQDDFLYDQRRIMVATNAFGMGIDKSNVSFVVHYNMPKNIESYYQEAGRAGRDGGPATCLLLYGARDVQTARFLIDHAREEDDGLTTEQRQALRAHDHALLKKMTWYCSTTQCLRGYILRYFGEHAPEKCGHCSLCDTTFETVDITTEAQKILSCILRITRQGRRFGKTVVAGILRGSHGREVLRTGMQSLPTYGIMKGEPTWRLYAIIDHLLEADIIRQSEDEYPTLYLAPDAEGLLRAERTLTIDLPVSSKEGDAATAHAAENPLFEKLRTLRSDLARKAAVPAYVIFSDAALRDMCAKLPVDEEQFLAVSGVGQKKAAQYAQVFTAAIRAHLQEDRPALLSDAQLPWSSEEDTQLRTERAGGRTLHEIAGSLGRTQTAVRARLHELL